MATPPIRAAYWISLHSFPASSVPPSLFNHVYYAFLQPDPRNFNLTITPNDQTKLPEFIASLSRLTPRVKTLLSIGGADNDKQVFSNMASTELNRQAFISSTIEVARTYGFDGVDLDWELPDNAVDMSNLGLLYEQWRKALDEDATARGKPSLLLTSAVYYASAVDYPPHTKIPYPAVAINNYVDWVNLMCYEYHGPWDNVTGAPAALYDDPKIDDSDKRDKNTIDGITLWIQAGVPANKLVMGLPLYGRSWTLQDERNHGIGAPAEGVQGEAFYRNIVVWNKEKEAPDVHDQPIETHYSYSGRTWIGYDGVLSVEAKVKCAKLRGLAGYFFWALGMDTTDWTLSRKAFEVWN